MNLPNLHVIEADGFGVNRLSLWTVGNRFIFSTAIMPTFIRSRIETLYTLQHSKICVFSSGVTRTKSLSVFGLSESGLPVRGLNVFTSLSVRTFNIASCAQKVKRKFGKKL